jgi:dipeptidyl aminopeptidase/acylaminoacyl peptidase
VLRVLGLLGALALVTGGATAPAATARAAGTLVFFSQRDPAGGLYAESAAGGPLRLLRTGVRDDGAHWSSDGKHVLFERDGDPVWTGNLWVAGADGRGAHVLARNAVQPTWAPDGRQAAFVRNGAIWIIRIDGTRLHRLSDPGDKRDGSARWSPDGRLIAFLRADQSGGPNESRLMTIRPNGSGLRLISHRVFFAPEWSPDSKRIAFDSSSPDGTGDFDPHAYVANVTGRSIRRIGALNNDLSWSRTGAGSRTSAEAAR